MEDTGYYYPLPLELRAALEEMRFWVRIMADHSKFIRNGFDPTEERLFRISDRFSMDFDDLLMRVQAPVQRPEEILFLMDRTIFLTGQLRDFKFRLEEMIQACQVLTNRPADLIDHIRREADYFLGKLSRIQRRPTPPREVIGLPDGESPTFLVSRLLIPEFCQYLREITVEENLFWLRVHSEHAEVLTLYFRPRIQDDLLRRTLELGRRLSAQLGRVENLPADPEAIRRFSNATIRLVQGWRDYLRELFADVTNCRVPTGQVNFPPLLADHMAREAEYHLLILEAINENLKV